MIEVEEEAQRLVRRLLGIADPTLRVQYVRHLLESAEPGWIADVVTVAAHATEARDHAYGTLMLSICLALADERCEELRETVAREAAARGQHGTATLLHRPANSVPGDGDPAAPLEIVRGRPLMLGERKALARRRDRHLLARVLRDPHPDVIRILLANPALTEDDVVRLCAQRPIPPEVLREVFRAPRWAVQYRVRRAIVNNPFAPRDVALQVVLHLNATDARAVTQSSEIAPTVREAAERIAGLATVH